MPEDKVKLGDGVVDGLKREANQELQKIGKLFLQSVSDYVSGKIKNLEFDEIMSKLTKKDEEAIVSLWSSRLAEEGLVPKAYSGLPDNLLIDNLHQEGYLDGLYVGYVLAMMSLADNNAPDELVVSVRDAMRLYLSGHHYNGRMEITSRYENGEYGWIDRLSEDDQSTSNDNPA